MSVVLGCFRNNIVKHLGCTNSLVKGGFSLTKFLSVKALPSDNNASFLSVDIQCRREFADMLSEALLCFGASSTSIDEQHSYVQNEEICISSIYDISKDVRKSITHAADSIGLKYLPCYKVIKGYHSDWIKDIQESFHPVEVTKGLWIVPEWRTPLDLEATNIILNPGLAFGTGDHPTTKLCLLLLHEIIKGGESFLDYGTGSGILAIAALKFGADFAVGIDIDPQAITAARHNATLNNIESDVLQLYLVPSEEINSPSSDNMSTGLEDQIVSFAKPGATVALSGIITEQLPRIIGRYSEFLEDIAVSKMDDWACVSGKKRRI
ncbi:PrmA domain-containing protein [Heracleum sosnowskyi]|uniref:ETFB lysine methyltransferase n=1 Tax=Heracleum sosnowskyi TaxID=360622 RepID=A0AAD8GM17_9APIA|nr:PrmA domain-containing protein [Heracleum sosnowskyi]KAK1397006.1 PrmA domain-containing protein [Heracleum sosnowskyi]